MSVDLNWELLTSGPDGAARAENIRAFIDDKFQAVPFPQFIKSVHVHSFSFGSVAPEIEIKDICDPYTQFYEDSDESGGESDSDDADTAQELLARERERRRRERKRDAVDEDRHGPPPYGTTPPRRPLLERFPTGRVGVTGVTTPLFTPLQTAGSSGNLHYFHSALSTGFSNGTNTPTFTPFQAIVRPPSSPSRPSSPDSLQSPKLGSLPNLSTLNLGHSDDDDDDDDDDKGDDDGGQQTQRSSSRSPLLREPRELDTQVIARVRYAGDVRLELTAELLFEYPVTNFVALPVRLVVTGCTFDGLACVAYIRRRAHFCFLDEPSDGGGGDDGDENLLKHITVESEIGEKGKGRQVLKNVGKVERFVLEQVRRIFEEEFVFPSSWTFLL